MTFEEWSQVLWWVWIEKPQEQFCSESRAWSRGRAWRLIGDYIDGAGNKLSWDEQSLANG